MYPWIGSWDLFFNGKAIGVEADRVVADTGPGLVDLFWHWRDGEVQAPKLKGHRARNRGSVGRCYEEHLRLGLGEDGCRKRAQGEQR